MLFGNYWKGLGGYLYDYDETVNATVDSGTSGVDFSIDGDISDSKSATWTPTQIMNRETPLQGYASSEPRVVGLTMIFVAQEDVLKEVQDKVNFVKSFVYPDYKTASPYPQPPHRVKLAYGSVEIVGVITSCDTTWSSELVVPTGGLSDILTGTGFRSLKASVAISIMEVREEELPDVFYVRWAGDGDIT
jgi:hypothetical protein